MVEKTLIRNRATGNRNRAIPRTPKTRYKIKKRNDDRYITEKERLKNAETEAYRSLFEDYDNRRESAKFVIWEEPLNVHYKDNNRYIKTYYAGIIEKDSYGVPALIILQHFGDDDNRETSISIKKQNKWKTFFGYDILEQTMYARDIERTQDRLSDKEYFE
jgi:hypothetical protein